MITPAPGFVSFNREQIYAALFALVSAPEVFDWKVKSRRLKLWGDVPDESCPALFQYEGEDESYNWTAMPNPTVTLRAKLFVYTRCPADTDIGSQQLNNIMDALHGVMMPARGPMMMGGRQTLGGLVQWARISGNVDRTPGDIDGEGMLMVPIEILANG